MNLPWQIIPLIGLIIYLTWAILFVGRPPKPQVKNPRVRRKQ